MEKSILSFQKYWKYQIIASSGMIIKGIKSTGELKPSAQDSGDLQLVYYLASKKLLSYGFKETLLSSNNLFLLLFSIGRIYIPQSYVSSLTRISYCFIFYIEIVMEKLSRNANYVNLFQSWDLSKQGSTRIVGILFPCSLEYQIFTLKQLR